MLDIPILLNRLDQRGGKADIDDLELAALLASLKHRSKNPLSRCFALDCHAPGLRRKLLRLHEAEHKPYTHLVPQPYERPDQPRHVTADTPPDHVVRPFQHDAHSPQAI